MHATAILRRCLSDVLDSMHAARSRRLMSAVEALIQGRRLTLTDLARSWPGATWMHAPLKALDRLLSNAHLHQAIEPLQRAMAHWLLRHPRPVLVVDWSDLKGDKRWCVLRAAVPVGGRSLTVYEQIFPLCRMGQPRAQREFLQEMRLRLPAQVCPIIVTDAGFRSDWYRSVQALGWDFIGRLRNNTRVQRRSSALWQPCASLHERARPKVRNLGDYAIVKGNPLSVRLVLIRRYRSRHQPSAHAQTRSGSTYHQKCSKAAREPWLLATSLTESAFPAAQIVAAYAKRMQIEEAFRDLKSHRYGVGFEDSSTRRAERLSVLMMLHSLACFAAWLLGLVLATVQLADPLARQRSHHNRYSRQRRSLEWLRRSALPPNLGAALRRTPFEPLVDAGLRS